MRKITVLGGDQRFLYTAKLLQNSGFSVTLCGFDDFPITLSGDIVLPLPFSRDKSFISMPNFDLPIADFLYTVSENTTVFGGMLTESFCNAVREKGAIPVDYYDADLILKNAALTAQGVLMTIKQQTELPFSSVKAAVTGFGRTGKEIALALQKAGISVCCAARRQESREAAAALGIEAVDFPYLFAHLPEWNLLINTVPSPIFTRDVLQNARKGTVILEIASPPFGTDFDFCAEFGIKAVKALGLPGKCTPKAAGEIIAEKIIEYYK